MIGYITLGTKNLATSGPFYDALLGSIGASRVMEESGYFIAWAKSQGDTQLSVVMPFNKAPASVGNGTMVGLQMDTPEQVDSFYYKAISLGATCEGKPGFRPEGADSGFYAGYFRDVDGNKLNAFCMVKDAT